MITYQALTSMEEMEEVHDLQANIWGKNAAVPTHQTSTAVKNGGIIIGAYDKEQLVGFSYGFAGFQDGKSYLCSHMLGIAKGYRSKRIGETLKQKQREIATSKGYDMMKWTFDPLETRNGYLNLTKIHGICDTYIENCYGHMQDGLNKGLPSDRFEIHWYLTSPHVTKKQIPVMENPTSLNSIFYNEEGLPVFKTTDITALTEPIYSLHVPTDFQGLKAQDHKLALDWRLQTRPQFQRLFQNGYAAVHIKKHETYASYIFVKKDTLKLGGNTK